MTGRFIAFEGGEACGKSTQSGRLADGLDAVITREPGGTAIGARLRALLLDPDTAGLDRRAEALLMAADRAQHVDQVVRPALDTGRWVVTDRFSASTLAYQGYGRGLDRSDLERLVGWATGGLVPDLTVFIQVPIAVARQRRRGAADRFEAEDKEFQFRVADGFLQLAARPPTPWVTIDGGPPVDEVAAAVWSGVTDRIGVPGGG